MNDLVAAIAPYLVLAITIAIPIIIFVGRNYVEKRINYHYSKLLEDYKQEFILENQKINSDSSLYKLFNKDLPYDRSIQYLKETEFHGSFEWKKLRDLDSFCEKWNEPQFYFLDKEIDNFRILIITCYRSFKSLLASKSGVEESGNPRYFSIYPEFEHNNGKEYEAFVDKVHEKADEVVAAYNNLVVLARKRLFHVFEDGDTEWSSVS